MILYFLKFLFDRYHPVHSQYNTTPVDTGRKLKVHKTSWTSSKRVMYVQFTSCVRAQLKNFVNVTATAVLLILYKFLFHYSLISEFVL